MKRLTVLAALAGAMVLTQAARAQVVASQGVPSTARILDFDVRSAPLGPISGTDSAFQSVAIDEVRLVPEWTPGGDVLTAGSNVDGRALVSQDGELVVAEAGDPLDDPGPGAGFDITFTTFIGQFGVVFVDEIDMEYTVELFLRGASLGSSTFTYTSPTGGFPAPPVYWSDTEEQHFDRIVITSASGGGGWGLDRLAVALDRCGGDCDGNFALDIFDLLCFQDAFVAMDPYANCDGDNDFDIFDFLCYQDSWLAGCP